MSATPFWFGPEERPLQGWLHRPDDGRARGAVVICPPVGIDLSHSHGNLHLLACTLEAAGFVALRFDYDGTGQSAGTMQDPDRVTAWIDSIQAALSVVRDAGAEWVGAIGLRLGATLTAATATEADLDALVLWDPYVSGNAFLREQRATQVGVLPHISEDVDGVAIPGYVIPPASTTALGSFELTEGRDLRATDVLVMTDPARRRGQRLIDRLSTGKVEWQEYCEPSDLFDTGRLDYVVPKPLIRQVASWTASRCDREAVDLPNWEPGAHTAIVQHCDDGRQVTEELLSIGPMGLFGIECNAPQPSDRPAIDHPTVLFLSIADESSIGPARQWADYARLLAAEGIRSVRFDLSGIGESPRRPGQRERPLYATEGTDDIVDAAVAVCPEDPRDVVLVGVCSGAYAALAAARRVRPAGIVAVNPIMTESESDQTVAPAEPGTGSQSDQPSGRAGPPRSLRAALTSLTAFGRGVARRSQIVNRLPPSAWRAIYGLGLARSPARLLAPVWKENVSTLLVCGEDEARLPKKRTPWALRRLAANGTSRFVEMQTLNHSLLHEENRATIFSMLDDFLAEVTPAPAEAKSRDTHPETAALSAGALEASFPRPSPRRQE